MTVGYARVSTTSQHLDMQLDALTASGCTRIHTDTASGALAARPGLDQALNELDEGDTLVVWRLDRLGRPTVWTPQRAEAAAALLAAGATVTQVAHALGISRATVYRHASLPDTPRPAAAPLEGSESVG